MCQTLERIFDQKIVIMPKDVSCHGYRRLFRDKRLCKTIYDYFCTPQCTHNVTRCSPHSSDTCNSF